MAKTHELYIGIMSGTSFDGIDIALISCKDGLPSLIEVHGYAMPGELKRRLHHLTESESVQLQQVGEIDRQLGGLYADTINDFLTHIPYKAHDIAAIGCHGQTVWHAPTAIGHLLCNLVMRTLSQFVPG